MMAFNSDVVDVVEHEPGAAPTSDEVTTRIQKTSTKLRLLSRRALEMNGVSFSEAVDATNVTLERAAARQRDQQIKKITTVGDAYTAKPVARVEFSVLTEREVRLIATNHDGPIVIDKQKRYDHRTGGALHGGLYDPRMGPVQANKACPTCGGVTMGYDPHLEPAPGGVYACPGHAGQMPMAGALFGPTLIKDIVEVLQCVCHDCGELPAEPAKCRLVIDNLLARDINGRPRSRDERLHLLSKAMRDQKRCCACQARQSCTNHCAPVSLAATAGSVDQRCLACKAGKLCTEGCTYDAQTRVRINQCKSCARKRHWRAQIVGPKSRAPGATKGRGGGNNFTSFPHRVVFKIESARARADFRRFAQERDIKDEEFVLNPERARAMVRHLSPLVALLLVDHLPDPPLPKPVMPPGASMTTALFMLVCGRDTPDLRHMYRVQALEFFFGMVPRDILVAPPCVRPADVMGGALEDSRTNELTLRYEDLGKKNAELRARAASSARARTVGVHDTDAESVHAGAVLRFANDEPWYALTTADLDYVREDYGLLQYFYVLLVDPSLATKWLPTTRTVSVPNSARRGAERTKNKGRGFATDQRGKGGLFRENLMGKRVDYSGRSVITGDPNIDIDELGVPYEIAGKITVPERLTGLNRDVIYESAMRRATLGADEEFERMRQFCDTLLLISPDGTEAINYLESGALAQCKYARSVGAVYQRPLRNGDIVAFNRAPSLHKPSIMAHRVRVMWGATFRLNLCVVGPYNADFDGDEMNVHGPQSLEAMVELTVLCAVEQNIILQRRGSPCIALVQDHLLAAGMLGHKDTFFDVVQAVHLLFAAQRTAEAAAAATRLGNDVDGAFRYDAFLLPVPAVRVRVHAGTKGDRASSAWKSLWTGLQIVSTQLPEWLTPAERPALDATYMDHVPRKENGEQAQVPLLIVAGEILHGTLNKRTVGITRNSLVHKILVSTHCQSSCNDTGGQFSSAATAAATRHLNGMVRLTTAYLTDESFSVGLEDVMLRDKRVQARINQLRFGPAPQQPTRDLPTAIAALRVQRDREPCAHSQMATATATAAAATGDETHAARQQRLAEIVTLERLRVSTTRVGSEERAAYDDELAQRRAVRCAACVADIDAQIARLEEIVRLEHQRSVLGERNVALNARIAALRALTPDEQALLVTYPGVERAVSTLIDAHMESERKYAFKGDRTGERMHSQMMRVTRLETRIRNAQAQICSAIYCLLMNSLDPRNGMRRMVDVGSKGNITNIGQMSGCVGPQEFFGRRICDTNPWLESNFESADETLGSLRRLMKPASGERTSPHWTRGYPGAVEGGYILRSLIEGIGAHGMWPYTQSGRSGLIDTACRTSETGYLQRQMIKCIEDHAVAHDGTVRNVDNRVVSFGAGDGIIYDPSFLVPTHCPALSLAEADFERCVVTEPSRDSNFINIWSVQTSAGDAHAQRQLLDTLERERVALYGARATLRALAGTDAGDLFRTVGDVEAVIGESLRAAGVRRSAVPLAFRQCAAPRGAATKQPLDWSLANADAAQRWYASLANTDVGNTGGGGRVPDLQELVERVQRWLTVDLRGACNEITRCNLRLRLSAKQLLLRHCVSIEALEIFFERYRHLLFRARMAAGEAIGIIAAQSIVEPLMQQTMRTLHGVGKTMNEVTQGVPRAKELASIRPTETMPTPIVVATLLPLGKPLDALRHSVRESLVAQSILVGCISVRQDLDIVLGLRLANSALSAADQRANDALERMVRALPVQVPPVDGNIAETDNDRDDGTLIGSASQRGRGRARGRARGSRGRGRVTPLTGRKRLSANDAAAAASTTASASLARLEPARAAAERAHRAALEQYVVGAFSAMQLDDSVQRAHTLARVVGEWHVCTTRELLVRRFGKLGVRGDAPSALAVYTLMERVGAPSALVAVLAQPLGDGIACANALAYALWEACVVCAPHAAQYCAVEPLYDPIMETTCALVVVAANPRLYLSLRLQRDTIALAFCRETAHADGGAAASRLLAATRAQLAVPGSAWAQPAAAADELELARAETALAPLRRALMPQALADGIVQTAIIYAPVRRMAHTDAADQCYELCTPLAESDANDDERQMAEAFYSLGALARDVPLGCDCGSSNDAGTDDGTRCMGSFLGTVHIALRWFTETGITPDQLRARLSEHIECMRPGNSAPMHTMYIGDANSTNYVALHVRVHTCALEALAARDWSAASNDTDISPELELLTPAMLVENSATGGGGADDDGDAETLAGRQQRRAEQYRMWKEGSLDLQLKRDTYYVNELRRQHGLVENFDNSRYIVPLAVALDRHAAQLIAQRNEMHRVRRAVPMALDAALQRVHEMLIECRAFVDANIAQSAAAATDAAGPIEWLVPMPDVAAQYAAQQREQTERNKQRPVSRTLFNPDIIEQARIYFREANIPDPIRDVDHDVTPPRAVSREEFADQAAELETARQLNQLRRTLAMIEAFAVNSNATARYFNLDVQKRPIYTAEGGVERVETHAATLDSRSLQNVLSVRGVDISRTTTNAVRDVEAVLGLEAARRALFDEYGKTLETSDVAHCYLSAVADAQSYHGYLLPMSRHGAEYMDSDRLKLATYEENSNVTTQAAVEAARINSIDSPSALLMFAMQNSGRFGTQAAHLLPDRAALERGTALEQGGEDDPLTSSMVLASALDALGTSGAFAAAWPGIYGGGAGGAVRADDANGLSSTAKVGDVANDMSRDIEHDDICTQNQQFEALARSLGIDVHGSEFRALRAEANITNANGDVVGQFSPLRGTSMERDVDDNGDDDANDTDQPETSYDEQQEDAATERSVALVDQRAAMATATGNEDMPYSPSQPGMGNHQQYQVDKAPAVPVPVDDLGITEPYSPSHPGMNDTGTVVPPPHVVRVAKAPARLQPTNISHLRAAVVDLQQSLANAPSAARIIRRFDFE